MAAPPELAAVAAARRALDAARDGYQASLVAARAAGHTLDAIGGAAGITRQAAFKATRSQGPPPSQRLRTPPVG